jgi:8-oxo-dGTP diphosphatase
VAADSRPPIVVLAGVIERDGRLLVTQRLRNTHLAEYWEFPGGKCEPDETHEACLKRELLEELDTDADIGPEILTAEHAYPERTVRLHFRWCRLHGDPKPMLGQAIRWVTREELAALRFPVADQELIGILASQKSQVSSRK